MQMNDRKLFDARKRYFIYGAGDVAREVLFCLQSAPRNLNIEAFIVSESCAGKSRMVDGIPVISFDDFKYSDDTRIIVAVLEKYRDEICTKLHSIGIQNPILMTFESDLWCEERGKTYALYRQEREKKPYILLQDGISHHLSEVRKRKSLQIYIAKSHMDKPLKENVRSYPWEKDIQVGAALTKKKIADITDFSGDNISKKNRQYCELTALYWIWKNDKNDYAGLCHYRRRFVLTEEEIERLVSSCVDVVVTNPVVNVPDVLTMYRKNHSYHDWEIMKDGIRRLCHEYLTSLAYVEKSNYYIPYNMFIMRRDILNHYCEWIFPILDYCEAMCEQKGDVYQNRYIGFLAERLMTVYLHHHRETLQVIFSKKHFCE